MRSEPTPRPTCRRVQVVGVVHVSSGLRPPLLCDGVHPREEAKDPSLRVHSRKGRARALAG